MYSRSYSPSFSRQREQPMVLRSPQPTVQTPPSPLKRIPRIIDTNEDFNPFPFLRDQYPDRDLLTDHPSPPRRESSSEESGNEAIDASGDLMDFDDEIDESFSPISSSVVQASILNATRQAEEDEDNGADLYEESDDFCSTKPSSDKIVQDADWPDTPLLHMGELVSSSKLNVEQNVRRVSSPLSRLPDEFEEGNTEATIVMDLNAPSSNNGDGQVDQEASDAAAEGMLEWLESLSEKDWMHAAAALEQHTKQTSESAPEAIRIEESAEDIENAEYRAATSGDEKVQLGTDSGSYEDWAGARAATETLTELDQQFLKLEHDDNGSLEYGDVVDAMQLEGSNLGTAEAQSEALKTDAHSDSSSELEYHCEYVDLKVEPEQRMFNPVGRDWIVLPQDHAQRKKLMLELFFTWTTLIFPTTLVLTECTIFTDYPRNVTDTDVLEEVGIHYASWIPLFTPYETASLLVAQHNKLRIDIRARTKTVIEEWCMTASFPSLPESKDDAEKQITRPGAAEIRRISTMLLLSPQTRKSERWIRFIAKLDQKIKLTRQHYDIYVPNICKLVEEFYTGTSCLMYSFAEEFQEINEANKTLKNVVEKELTCALEMLKL